MRPVPLLALCCAAALVLTGACTSVPEQDTTGLTAERPNIIVILADDMGYSDLGSYGGEIATPNLDRLAETGLRFTSFYTAPVCAPTRASLMTGRYSHQVGVGFLIQDWGLPGYRGTLDAGTATLAELLKSGGYHTYMSGKWHLTGDLGHWTGDETRMSKESWPLQRGFDAFYGTITGAGSFFDPVTLTEGNTPLPRPGDEYYYTDAISWRAVEFIEDHESGAGETPFFLYVAYTAPHWPLHAPGERIDENDAYGQGWAAVRAARFERMQSLGLVPDTAELPPAPDAETPWDALSPSQRAWRQEQMEVYAAQMRSMDAGIGELLAALERHGARDNTVIFFLSDNGASAEVMAPGLANIIFPRDTPDGRVVTLGNVEGLMPGPDTTYQSYGPEWAAVSNTPFRQFKYSAFEGGIASPLIVNWPAGLADPGRQIDAPVHVIDLMPTIAALAGVDGVAAVGERTVGPFEGVSLADTLAGEPIEPAERRLYWESVGNRAVRSGKWKLVAPSPGLEWELYDVEADPGETNDLAARHPELVADLSAAYAAWATRSQVEDWRRIAEEIRPCPPLCGPPPADQ